jgi:hypothetical protein
MSELDQLIGVLTRIAAAFEEQNRSNAEWIAQQKGWHAEEEASNKERHEDYRKWHDEAEKVSEQRYQEQFTREQALRDAYIASLGLQEKEE